VKSLIASHATGTLTEGGTATPDTTNPAFPNQQGDKLLDFEFGPFSASDQCMRSGDES